MADAREAGIHFIAAGHYATETFGVRRLGDLLAERFGVEHRWSTFRIPCEAGCLAQVERIALRTSGRLATFL